MAYSDKEKEKIINSICDRVAKGEVLRNILAEKGMIDRTTFYRWIDSDESKSKQYARACNERADTIFDEMFEIADNGSNDWKQTEKGLRVDNEAVQRSRLRIDTRKWALSKMNPKKYGDKLDLTNDSGKFEQNVLILPSNGHEVLDDSKKQDEI